MKQPFRLYYLPQCEHCIEVIGRLGNAGIPFQLVDSTQDPIATGGIEKMLGQVAFPVLVAFEEHQIIKGNNGEAIDKLIDSYRVRTGTAAANPISDGREAL